MVFSRKPGGRGALRPQLDGLTLREGVGYLPESVALFARMTSQPDATRKSHINTLIKALKDAGVWAKLDVLQVYAAHNGQASLLNWISDQYNGAGVNSPTFTTDRGYFPDGAASYVRTGLNPITAVSSKFVLNDAFMMLFAADLASAGRAGNTTSRIGWEITPATYTRGNDASTTSNAIAADTRQVSWSRGGSGSYVQRAKGSDVATVSVASTAVTSEEFTVGRIGGIAVYGAGGARAFAAGSSMSQTLDAALHTALTTYFTAIGAIS